MLTNMGGGSHGLSGDKAYVDHLFGFSAVLGTDYSGSWQGGESSACADGGATTLHPCFVITVADTLDALDAATAACAEDGAAAGDLGARARAWSAGLGAGAETVLALMATTCIPFNMFLAASMTASSDSFRQVRRGVGFASFMTAVISILIVVFGNKTLDQPTRYGRAVVAWVVPM